MYPDILISSFFGVLFPVIQLFCDLFFLFFTLNVPRNLHFFIYWGISFFYKNFMLYFIVLFCQFRTPKFSIFVILGYITTTNTIFRLVCGVCLCILILYVTFLLCFSSVKNHNNCCGCFTFPAKKSLPHLSVWEAFLTSILPRHNTF